MDSFSAKEINAVVQPTSEAALRDNPYLDLYIMRLKQICVTQTELLFAAFVANFCRLWPFGVLS